MLLEVWQKTGFQLLLVFKSVHLMRAEQHGSYSELRKKPQCHNREAAEVASGMPQRRSCDVSVVVATVIEAVPFEYLFVYIQRLESQPLP